MDQNKVQGEYGVQHLRFHPDFKEAAMPLWDQYCAAIERDDKPEQSRLRAEMRPFQYVVSEESFSNLVTTVGKNACLDSILGNAAAGAVVMGLKGTGSANVADTQASHAGWLEQGGANAPTFTGNRPSPSFSAAAAGSKATSAAVAFAITSSGTVFGCFINIGGSSTKDNTTGVLFSAGDFSGGSKAVVNTDTLNVTYTLTA